MTENIVLLTGAGISAESGLKTFRGEDGLWEGEPVTEVATPQAFQRNPERVQGFYNMRRAQLSEVQPNRAHRALADWQASNSGITLVTQNVDDLHERAGSTPVWHMHGELKRARCTQCKEETAWHTHIDDSSLCPHCGLKGRLRPDIVWFGEMPKLMDQIEQVLTRCQLFVAIGTSGLVYPAAGFAQLAKAYGAAIVEINLEPTQASNAFDYCIHGPATIAVPEFITSFSAAQGSLVDRLSVAAAHAGG